MNFLEKLKTFLPTVPLATSAVTLFNTASARDHFMRGPGFGGFFSLLVSLLLIALLVLAILYLFQLYRARQQPSSAPPEVRSTEARVTPSTDSALTILRERLAKGEIEVDDYEARRRVLLEK
jgi:uncharacterized membrane protein